MAGTSYKWLEWVFSGVGVAVLGYVGKLLFRWYKPDSVSPQPIDGASADSEATGAGAQANSLAIGAGASLTNSPIIGGSNNVQQVTITNNISGEKVPISQRKPSLPTANEIRQQQYALPPFQQQDFPQQFVNMKVRWPVRVQDVSGVDDYCCHLDCTYGEERWGAVITCVVPIKDYPIIRIVKPGHWVWVEGTIYKIDYAFNLRDVKLEFE